MSLDHAILGFLQYRPSTGYDLKGMFDLSVRHFWPADQSQIYRTLSRIADRGWAEVEIVPQSGRPDQKLYHITAAGQDELVRWLASPAAKNDSRSEFLVQVFFAGRLPDEQVLALFRQASDECRRGLEHLRQVPELAQPHMDAVKSPREGWCWMLTLECGIRMTEAHLLWLESVIKRIEGGEMPPFLVEEE